MSDDFDKLLKAAQAGERGRIRIIIDETDEVWVDFTVPVEIVFAIRDDAAERGVAPETLLRDFLINELHKMTN